MIIVHINAVSGIRSTGRICAEIIDYLNENGHQGYLVFSQGHSNKGYKIGNQYEQWLHGILSRITGKQAYFSRFGTWRLLKYLDRIKPDLIHLHNLHGNYINLPMLLQYLAQRDIPTVLTLHDCWFYTGKCCHYTVTNCYKWKTQCHHCPRLHNDNPSWFFDRTNKMYQDKEKLFQQINRLAVVGVSHWITKEAKQSYLNKARIITRIYNWVDTEVFKPVDFTVLEERMNLKDKFIILGIASHWNEDKGLQQFINLSQLLLDDMKIILIGEINEDMNNYKNIIHIQEIHNITNLVQYYSMADLFIQLSKEESFGKVTIEAMACGTPAIVLDTTANPELIGNQCGYVVEADNINAILDKINQVKHNKKSFYTIHCRDYVVNHFRKDDRLKDYFQLYSQLIQLDKLED